MANTIPARQEWADAKLIESMFGIKRGLLYSLAADGRVKSSCLRKRGEIKGKRLFSTDSVAALIESQAEAQHTKLGSKKKIEAAPREAH